MLDLGHFKNQEIGIGIKLHSTSERVIRRVSNILQIFRVPILGVLAIIGILYIDKPPLWPGFLVAAFGESIQLWAASQLHKNTVLADSGPYAHVRNPMYLGRFFLGLGFLMLLHNPYVLIIYVIGFAVYAHLRVGGEEERLREVFGEEYERYTKEVRRWLPRLTPYKRTSGRRLSWSRIVANHEYRNAVGLVIVLVLIVLRVQEYPNIEGLEFLRRLLGL